MTTEAPSTPQPAQDPDIAELIVANALDYAIITMDDDGRITSWSPGAERIFGYSAAEAVGMMLRELFVPADIAADADRRELEIAAAEGRAEDSRWHVRKNGEHFWANGVAMALSMGARSGFLKILRDETRLKLADEQRILLLNELNHRIKNTLATVQSIAEQTLRAGDVDPATRENFTNRLLALSEAHNLLVAENWAGADLHAIVGQALAPYGQPDAPRFAIEGPSVRLSPQQAVALSLVLHELATNAVKYGALSVPNGTIAVSWNLAVDGAGRRNLNLLWEENGGPPVCTPEQTGFGTRLIAKSFGRENGGRARLHFNPTGLRCVIELPLSNAEEASLLDPTREGG
jgi:PAS domain S-box-containing protein